MIENTGKLANRTIFITGECKEINREIALKAAKDGANIVIAFSGPAKDIKQQKTFLCIQEIEKVGGRGIACPVDVRDEKQISAAIAMAIKTFEGIDILINNASVVGLTGTEDTAMKDYDLMQSVNARGTFLVTKLCLPYLKRSNFGHILNITPPLSLSSEWVVPHVPYTISKYSMSICVLGMYEEFRKYRISVNALWPRTLILEDAEFEREMNAKYTRKPQIMADAAYCILTQDPKPTGKFFIDDEVLAAAGVRDLDQYAFNHLYRDLISLNSFIDDSLPRTNLAIDESELTEVNPSTSGCTRKLSDAFETIQNNLSRKLVHDIQAIYQLVMTGDDVEVWYIDLRCGSGFCGKGTPPQKADAILTMRKNSFLDMIAGKLTPTKAFVTGKLIVTGNMRKALKLDDLMKSIQIRNEEPEETLIRTVTH